MEPLGRSRNRLLGRPPSRDEEYVKKRESPDVVIVVLDRVVGAPYLSRDSLTDPISRELASKLDDAVWFDHAVSTSSWTVPAHASILTGALPLELCLFRSERQPVAHP